MKRTITSLLFVLVGLALARTDFAQAQNPDRLAQASPEVKKLFNENGFIAQPTDYAQLYDLYKTIRKADRPMLVTTDCVLHSFHVIFDYTLRDIETRYFYPDLKDLTSALLQYERHVLASAKPATMRDALTANIAFLSVAAALADTGFTIPPKVEKTVKAELALIEAHQGIAKSPVMGFDEDYSQYAPRGHYTRSELLKRYFKAMMWYGRIGFALKPGNQDKDIEFGRKLTYQALLLCDAIRQAKVGAETALVVWTRIYEPTVLLVGKSDDLSVQDYLKLSDQVFGDKNPLPDRPSDAQLDQFIKLALALRGPKIVSQPVPDTLNPAQTTKGFRLMGQRYIPDSYIFQELVYDKVGTRDDPRTMPKGLDVFAALGSEPARKILKERYHEDRYQNYETQLDKLAQEFDQLTPGRLEPERLFRLAVCPETGKPAGSEEQVSARLPVCPGVCRQVPGDHMRLLGPVAPRHNPVCQAELHDAHHRDADGTQRRPAPGRLCRTQTRVLCSDCRPRRPDDAGSQTVRRPERRGKFAARRPLGLDRHPPGHR